MKQYRLYYVNTNDPRDDRRFYIVYDRILNNVHRSKCFFYYPDKQLTSNGNFGLDGTYEFIPKITSSKEVKSAINEEDYQKLVTIIKNKK